MDTTSVQGPGQRYGRLTPTKYANHQGSTPALTQRLLAIPPATTFAALLGATFVAQFATELGANLRAIKDHPETEELLRIELDCLHGKHLEGG